MTLIAYGEDQVGVHDSSALAVGIPWGNSPLLKWLLFDTGWGPPSEFAKLVYEPKKINPYFH